MLLSDIIPVILVTLAVAVAFGLHLRVEKSRRDKDRANFLSLCLTAFSDRIQVLLPTGFPRLSGRWQGDTWDIQIVPDTLSLRKLPALWVLVSLPVAVPVRGHLDLMLRPTGVVTFSNFEQLACQIQPPDGFPSDSGLRTDDPAHMPDPSLLAAILTGVTTDYLKEILITPKGVRVVFLAEQAVRSRYLLFRDSEMGRSPLDLVMLIQAMQMAQNLRDIYSPPAKEPLSA